MQTFSLKILLLLSLFGQSKAGWVEINDRTCAFLLFLPTSPKCPGGFHVAPPAPPAPNPKQVAQSYCDSKASPAKAVFLADNTFWGCVNSPCTEINYPGSHEVNGLCP